MAYDALEVVKLRNDFYRDSYRKLVILLMGAMLSIVGLVIAIIMIVYARPAPTYFATTESGRIIPLIPLDQPNLTDNAVLQWATQAVTTVFTYNFINYRSVLQSSRQYFTAEGWRQFLLALQSSRNLSMVTSKKLMLSAVVSSAPVVLNEYLLDGKYTWKVQIPISVTYQSLSETAHDSFIISLTIERISTLDSISGVGISSFVAQLRS